MEGNDLYNMLFGSNGGHGKVDASDSEEMLACLQVADQWLSRFRPNDEKEKERLDDFLSSLRYVIRKNGG